MADWSTGSLAEQVEFRIPNIPSTISTGSIQQFIENSIYDVQNFTGDSISTTTVPDKYKNILINIGCAYTYAHMMDESPDINFDVSVGEFKVKNTTDSPESKKLEFCMEQANRSLSAVGRRAFFNRTY